MLYRNANSSSKCVKELHKTSKMGQLIKAYIDPKGIHFIYYSHNINSHIICKINNVYIIYSVLITIN